MPKTMKAISADWKELRPLIGNLIGHLTSKEAQLVSMEEAYERGRTDGWAERGSLKSSEISDAYDKGYTEGFECGQHEVTTLEYQRGLNDAWEAAKKLSIMTAEEAGRIIPGAEKYNRFNLGYSGVEIVKILRAYDEQKKAEEEAEIKVGDEVTTGFSTFVVIKTDETQYIGFDRSAVLCKADKCICKKTGRSFSQVSELLKAMEGSDG